MCLFKKPNDYAEYEQCKKDQNIDISYREYLEYKKFVNDKSRMLIWGVVRYRNGVYDNVWCSGMTKRDADKLCAKLNNDYHKNYGDYVVEMNP